MSTQHLTYVILKRIGAVLFPLGFKQSRNTFVLKNEDVLILVNLQKSVKSTSSESIVTINLGVYSELIAAKLGINKPPHIWNCHWRIRLGHVLPQHKDLWWKAETVEQAHQISEEIATSLKEYGIPAIEEVASTAKLYALWNSGQSPGLTRLERVQFIEELSDLIS